MKKAGQAEEAAKKSRLMPAKAGQRLKWMHARHGFYCLVDINCRCPYTPLLRQALHFSQLFIFRSMNTISQPERSTMDELAR